MLKIHKLGGDELLSLLVTVKVGVVNLCEGLTLDFLRIGLTITIITFKDTCPKGGVLRLGIEDYAIEVEKSSERGTTMLVTLPTRALGSLK